MSSRLRVSIVLLLSFLCASAANAQDSGVRQDARAIKVLKSMSAYTASLDRVAIKGVSISDARLGRGLIFFRTVIVFVLGALFLFLAPRNRVTAC